LGYFSLLRLGVTVSRAASPASVGADDAAFFESRIQPVLSQKCYSCHSHTADRVKAGLMLDSRSGLLQGGNSGPAVVPGNPDDSLLIQAIRYTHEDLRMPPLKQGGRLSDAQIADFTDWVRRGAPDPRQSPALAGGNAYGGVGKQHWAFQPLKKPAVPSVSDQAWVKSPVDAFILKSLQAAHLTPNAEADKRTLIRRVTFDLTGLPPTEMEIEAFLSDSSPEAFSKVVDRLLDSPRYGEKWARYWMDLARYSDTKGDAPRRDDLRFPYAWTYRDYLITSFNADKPYGQFIREQLAADLLRKADLDKANAAKGP